MQTTPEVSASRAVAVTWHIASGLRSMLDDVSDYRRMIDNRRRRSETLRDLTRAVLVSAPTTPTMSAPLAVTASAA